VKRLNQNKCRVWLNKSISILTLQYIALIHSGLSHSWKVQGQKGCGTLHFKRGTQGWRDTTMHTQLGIERKSKLSRDYLCRRHKLYKNWTTVEYFFILKIGHFFQLLFDQDVVAHSLWQKGPVKPMWTLDLL